MLVRPANLTLILGQKNTHTFRIWGLFDPREFSIVICNGRNISMVDRDISPGSKKTPEPSMRVNGDNIFVLGRT